MQHGCDLVKMLGANDGHWTAGALHNQSGIPFVVSPSSMSG